MKTFAAALLMSTTVLSAGAYASSNVEPNNVPFQGVFGQRDDSVSRAQVAQELAQAKAQGQVSNVEPNNVAFQGAYGQDESIAKTRAQVRAELADAKAHGLVSNVEPNNVPFQGVFGGRDADNSRLAQGE